MADELAVRVGVSNEVAGGRHRRQLAGTLFRAQQDDRVIQHRVGMFGCEAVLHRDGHAPGIDDEPLEQFGIVLVPAEHVSATVEPDHDGPVVGGERLRHRSRWLVPAQLHPARCAVFRHHHPWVRQPRDARCGASRRSIGSHTFNTEAGEVAGCGPGERRAELRIEKIDEHRSRPPRRALRKPPPVEHNMSSNDAARLGRTGDGNDDRAGIP